MRSTGTSSKDSFQRSKPSEETDGIELDRSKRRRRTSKTPPSVAIAADLRSSMIAERAYYRAEQRGFVPGYEVEDWLVAEREVDERLGIPTEGEA